MDPSQNWASGNAVSADQIVGTVAQAGTRSNNGVAHIHVGAYTGSGCPTGGPIPLDASHGTVLGGYDLPSSGAANQYKGTTLTRNDGPPTPPSCAYTSCFQQWLFQSGTGLGLTDSNWAFKSGDIDRDGKPDLVGILMSGTGTHTTEIHALSGASSYQQRFFEVGTGLHETDPTNWTFAMTDWNHDGYVDLVAIAKQNTGSGTTEVHVLSGATSFQQFIVHSTTCLGPTGTNWRFEIGDFDADGSADLIGILMNGTGSGFTEVHVCSGASGLQQRIYDIATPLGETSPNQWDFMLGDVDRDGRPDLIGMVMYGTSTFSTEVHILSGASGYQQWIAHLGTVLGNTNALDFAFTFGDVNGDQAGDLMAVKKLNTGTGTTELHVLSGVPSAPPPDSDSDGIVDPLDNCPTTFNPGQENNVHPATSAGDACEDPDADGVVDASDNCPNNANPGQANVVHPATGAGDACEDPDADGVMDATDNCPDAANPGQANTVHPLTAAGDACEDPDADGVMDATDNCPDAANPGQANNDAAPAFPWVRDGVSVEGQTLGGDACDTNDDNDGCPDAKELLLVPATDPLNPWDFYSVPVPALFAAPDPTTVFKDSIVGISDAQSVFAYFKKGARTGTLEYEQDLNLNGIKDGVEYDRTVVGPAQSGPPDGTIGIVDAQLAFAQFKLGYRC